MSAEGNLRDLLREAVLEGLADVDLENLQPELRGVALADEVATIKARTLMGYAAIEKAMEYQPDPELEALLSETFQELLSARSELMAACPIGMRASLSSKTSSS